MSGVKGVEISDLLGLSGPLCKLIESVSRGVGKVYEPTHIKRIAKAKSEELKRISGAVNENIDLPISYKGGEIEIDSSDVEELLKRTGERFIFQEIQKQQNIETVIGYAYSELEEEEEDVSEESVDTDWILRFMNSIEDISNQEMQELWGKILAGEVRQPTTYSLRTLDALRNISADEAKRFERLCEFIVTISNDICIYNNNEILNKYNITFKDILLLEECGLVKSNGLSLKTKVNSDIDCKIYNSKVLGIIKGKNKEYKDIDFGIYMLSETGNQLYKTLNINGNENYAIDVIKLINETLSKEDYIINAHKINIIDSKGGINYYVENILEKL